MRRSNLRSQFLLLTLAALLTACVFGGASAWLLTHGVVGGKDESVWIAGLCAVAAIVAPLLFSLLAARRMSAAIASQAEIANAILTGTPARVPADVPIVELADACEKLVHAANVVRGREAALRAAGSAKDDFIAMLGHELRNPLNALASAAYVIKAIAREPAAKQSSDIVARQVTHMARLIEDLLDVNRVIRGKVSLSRQPLNLAQAVEAVLSELRVAGRLDAHELRVALSAVWVRADEARVRQMIANLVGNAIKYTPAGGRIEISARRDRDTAILRVQDTGVGMPLELSARVFDLFVQGTEAGNQEASHGGLGIGLALVKHLAELHGGKVYAASSGQGEGSTFTLSLPAIEAPMLQAAEADASAAAPGSAHRILLVEDNADTRNTLFAALQLDGHRVFEAADGHTGMRAVAAVKPDVAVIDIGLPDVDGYQIASALRDDPGRNKMVLIAITGTERPDSLRRAREAGFDEYVTKPIGPERLVRLIDAAKARRSAQANRSPI
jgi:signal transduction histidine kinase/ActR/RegA family two-component response regulator